MMTRGSRLVLISMLAFQVCFTGILVQAAVGDTCSQTSDCAAGTEYCSGTGCACNTLHGDDENGACVPKDCSGGVSVCGDNTKCNADSECECDATFQLDPVTGNCIAKGVGDQCTNAGNECDDIGNAVCTAGLTCQCKPTFKEDNGACVPIVLGDQCTDQECADISNAVCVGTPKTCQCPVEYKESSGACELRVLGDACDSSDDCAHIAGSECTSDTSVCKCLPSHKEDGKGGCVAKALEDACTETEDCKNIANMVNDAYCINNICACGPLHEGATCTQKTCSAADSTPCNGIENAECSEEVCTCATGYEINEQNGQCTLPPDNGATRARMTVLIALMLSVFYLC